MSLKWRQGFAGRAIDCPLAVCSCGRDSCPFCHCELEEILLFREKTEKKVERSIVLLLKEIWKNKKRNGSTNAETCISVVQAHRGADKKAVPRRTSSSGSGVALN